MKISELTGIYESANMPTVLFKRTSDAVADLLLAGKPAENRNKFQSFTDSKSRLKSEFGNRIISCRVKDLPLTARVIPIEYDLAWFKQSTLHKQLFKMITARTLGEWIKENGGLDAADEELETIYGEEHEIVVLGLDEFHPDIFKVLR